MEEAPTDLDLLRLRVLATRKRNKLEEGEISDSSKSERQAPPVGTSPVLGEGFYSYTATRPRNLKKKRPKLRNSAGFGGNVRELTESFLNGMYIEQMMSESFSPQRCIVVLDSEVEEEDEANRVSSPLVNSIEGKSSIEDCKSSIKDSNSFMSSKSTEEPASQLIVSSVEEPTKRLIAVSAEGSLFASKVAQKEVEKQQALLDSTKSALQQLESEKTLLGSKFQENEVLIREAVQKQLKLKNQVKETKSLIMKGKDMRADFETRLEVLSKAIAKKSKLVGMLESSIKSKAASASQSSSPIESEEDTASAETKTSDRAVQLLKLEKHALKVKQDLMAAQISLIQQRAVRIKTPSLAVTSKRPLVSALGKVMAMNPIMSESHALLPAEDNPACDALLSAAFPPRLFNLSGHLLDLDTISSVARVLSGLIEDKISVKSSNEQDTGCADQEEMPTIFVTLPAEHEAILPPIFSPYDSPLKSFKSYRFSPNFTYSAPHQGLLSRTYTNRINPEVPICSFDLTGRCTRKNCAAQHFRSIFMEDSSILEDFMKTLLCRPIKAPFRDQLHLLTQVKNKFLEKSNREKPLISLVGILIDMYRLMEPGPFSVSFKRRLQESGKLDLTFKSILTNVRKDEKLDARRSFLEGISDLCDGVLPRLWRYFDSKDAFKACQESVSADPRSEARWLEYFLLTLAAGNIRDHETLMKARNVLLAALKDGVPDSDLLLTVLVDFHTKLSEAVPSAHIQNSKTLHLAFIAGQVREFDQRMSDLELCIKRASSESSADVVDALLASVKVLCDFGHADNALSLLQVCLARTVDPNYHGLMNLSVVLSVIEQVPFSASDVSYLAMMYFYVRDTRVYPQQSFLSFPFDMMRRLDYHYCQPWSKPECWAEDFVYLQQLFLTLFLEDKDSPTLVWCSSNLLSLAEKLKISVDSIVPEAVSLMDLAPSTKAQILSVQAFHIFGPAEMNLVQSHPLILLRFLGVVLQMPEIEPVKQELIHNLLRAFWSDLLGILLPDDQMIIAIRRALGQASGVSVLEETSRDLGHLKKDPFTWILATISVGVFSAAPQPLGVYQSILESAITNVGDSTSSLLILSCIATVESREGIFTRMASLAEDSQIYPEAVVSQRWKSSPWYGKLESPLNEFVALNIPTADDMNSLLSSLYSDRVDLVVPSSPYLSFKYSLGLGVN
ncbi:hypothetical protein PSACC_02774 [Paramicrosporidium saccamoebae]|uniref:Zinc-finger domain-containing protein n=1 Tax=Paramicrosporidium saccamoebae TaxID=1246581 RepID=A0A2H9TI37_9FUNG|nr:hypothetical protein PSACC_02774 [Paramicrosporidium saccamoebae]